MLMNGQARVEWSDVELTKTEQKHKVGEFVAHGEKIGKIETTKGDGLSQVKGHQYEA